MALGRMWHPEHFICVHCKEQLGTQNFFERDTLPYCERDYYLLFSPRCASCNGPIFDVGKLYIFVVIIITILIIIELLHFIHVCC